jgi:hypothetical protein
MALTMQARGSLLFGMPKRDARRRTSLTARARDLLRAELGLASRLASTAGCELAAPSIFVLAAVIAF